MTRTATTAVHGSVASPTVFFQRATEKKELMIHFTFRTPRPARAGEEEHPGIQGHQGRHNANSWPFLFSSMFPSESIPTKRLPFQF